MNYLQVDFNWTRLAFLWGESGKVSQIRFLELAEGSFPGKTFSVSKNPIPAYLGDLIPRLSEYFEKGEPLSMPQWEVLDQSFWTSFQKQVFQVSCEIPHGETRSYSWVAWKLGKPKAVRAVGQALKRNPLPILIPCHRVVAQQGQIHGYMGRTREASAELDMKRQLLDLEYHYRNPVFPFLASSASLYSDSTFLFS